MYTELNLYLAYIDPGTGSFVAQVVAASIIGILVSIKAFWTNIRLFFLSRLLGKKVQLDEENNIQNETN